MDPLRLHPLTLRFVDASLEGEFWEDYASRTIRNARWPLMLGVLLFLPYGFVDERIAPEFVGLLWSIRVVVTLVVVAIVLLTFVPGAYRRFTPLVATGGLVSGIGLSAIGWFWGLSGTFSSHSGIIVLLIFVHVLIHMRFVAATLVGAAISLVYLGQLVLHPASTWLNVMEQGASILAGNLTGMFASYMLEGYARRIFWQTRGLEEREAELRAANAELSDALADLRNTQDQLIQSEKLASLGALTAGIAHEIKNPLNFVNNFAGLSRELVSELEQETDADTRRAILDDIRTNALKIEEHGRRADAIVRAMMEHARSGTGERRPTDAHALVQECINLAFHGMRARHPDAGVTLEHDLGPDLGEIEVVPREINRVLINLFDNAFDAVRERAQQVDTPFSPRVRVAARPVAAGIEILIEDNGAGISEKVRKRIFEPFFSTKPTGSGTGLGLSMSYDIVTKGYGGTLDVESEEGKGTRVRLMLPRG